MKILLSLFTLIILLFVISPFSAFALPPTCYADGCGPTSGCPPPRPFCRQFPGYDELLCCLIGPMKPEPKYGCKSLAYYNNNTCSALNCPDVCPKDRPILFKMGPLREHFCCETQPPSNGGE